MIALELNANATKLKLAGKKIGKSIKVLVSLDKGKVQKFEYVLYLRSRTCI